MPPRPLLDVPDASRMLPDAPFEVVPLANKRCPLTPEVPASTLPTVTLPDDLAVPIPDTASETVPPVAEDAEPLPPSILMCPENAATLPDPLVMRTVPATPLVASPVEMLSIPDEPASAPPLDMLTELLTPLDPDGELRTVTAPLLRVDPAPLDIDTRPPVEPPLSDPPDTKIAPPLADDELPADNSRDPLGPLAAVPVDIVTAPLDPPLVVPEPKLNRPLTPAVPASEDWTYTEPVDVWLLEPLVSDTKPPVALLLPPAVAAMLPPAAALLDPLAILIEPPDPAELDDPVTNRTCPEEPPGESPLITRTMPVTPFVPASLDRITTAPLDFDVPLPDEALTSPPVPAVEVPACSSV